MTLKRLTEWALIYSRMLSFSVFPNGWAFNPPVVDRAFEQTNKNKKPIYRNFPSSALHINRQMLETLSYQALHDSKVGRDQFAGELNAG